MRLQIRVCSGSLGLEGKPQLWTCNRGLTGETTKITDRSCLNTQKLSTSLMLVDSAANKLEAPSRLFVFICHVQVCSLSTHTYSSTQPQDVLLFELKPRYIEAFYVKVGTKHPLSTTYHFPPYLYKAGQVSEFSPRGTSKRS